MPSPRDGGGRSGATAVAARAMVANVRMAVALKRAPTGDGPRSRRAPTTPCRSGHSRDRHARLRRSGAMRRPAHPCDGAGCSGAAAVTARAMAENVGMAVALERAPTGDGPRSWQGSARRPRRSGHSRDRHARLRRSGAMQRPAHPCDGAGRSGAAAITARAMVVNVGMAVALKRAPTGDGPRSWPGSARRPCRSGHSRDRQARIRRSGAMRRPAHSCDGAGRSGATVITSRAMVVNARRAVALERAPTAVAARGGATARCRPRPCSRSAGPPSRRGSPA